VVGIATIAAKVKSLATVTLLGKVMTGLSFQVMLTVALGLKFVPLTPTEPSPPPSFTLSVMAAAAGGTVIAERSRLKISPCVHMPV
jgi:hypothetical protein